MQYNHRILLAMLAALPLLGCGKATEKPKAVQHATVEPVEARKATLLETNGAKPASATKPGAASDIRRVTLSEEAAKRLRIEFAEVKTSGERFELPYHALLYDPSGGEWVYVSPSPNVFMRADLKVDAIEGDTVYYSTGPAVGSKLVTAGAAELYGIEFGVGK